MSKAQVIFVMGVTGVGKSTFIQYATGHEVKVGHNLDPCTTVVQYYQIPDTNVYLLDTPGFDDPKLSDTDILTMISKCLEDFFNDKADIMGALYIHPITEPRMKRSGMTNLRMFKDIIGMDKMANVRLVTTKWSLQPQAKLEAHEKELATDEKYWKKLLARKAEIARFHDSWESALEILKPLVRGDSFMPLLLKERVCDGLSIPQTHAGQIVCDNVAEAKEVWEQKVKDLDKEWRQEMKNKESVFVAELLQEKKEAQAELQKSLDEQKKLQEMAAGRSRGKIGRWAARVGAVVVGGVATVVTGGIAGPAALALYGSVEAGAQVHRLNSR